MTTGNTLSKERLGKCRLCLEEKKLCFSHIIPEFMYRPTYGNNHRALVISKGQEKFKQIGEREYLLCENCDREIIGKWEKYASPIVKSIQDMKIDKFGDQYIINNIEYADFKLFQLSLLWRASVTSLKMFKDINIGVHEEVIRKMLLSSNAGQPYQYGCAMLVLPETKLLHRMIWSPMRETIDGFACFRFITGRIFWYFFLPDAYPDDARNIFLLQDGILRLQRLPLSEDQAIERLKRVIS